MVAQPEDSGDAVSFAFVVPDCEPGNRLSVRAPDGKNLMIPCPSNVKPGMKLVLNKSQDGVWRISHATENAPEPAKFALPPSSDQSPTTPPRAPSPGATEEQSRQTPGWAEPRQDGANARSTPMPKEDVNRNSTKALSPSGNSQVRRPGRANSRLSGSRGGRSVSPTTTVSSSRDSTALVPADKSRKSSPGLSGRTPNGGRSSSGNRRSLSTQASADNSSRTWSGREAEKLKDLIRGVYQRKNPAKLAELDELLEKHKGNEKGIYEHVCRKYGETPRPWSSKP